MAPLYDVDWPEEAAMTDAIRGVVNHLFVGRWLRRGMSAPGQFETWFQRLQQCRVPATAFTPAMCRLLYEVGFAAQAAELVGLGTYYGTALNLLVAGAMDEFPGVITERRMGMRAIGVDIDPDATRGAAENAKTMLLDGGVADPAAVPFLGGGPRVCYLVADARSFLARRRLPQTPPVQRECRNEESGDFDASGTEAPPAIDLLYLDVDDPVSGKAMYADLLEAAMPHLDPSAVVLAHDALVPKFRPDLKRLRERLRAFGFGLVVDVPVDRAGLVIAVRSRFHS